MESPFKQIFTFEKHPAGGWMVISMMIENQETIFNKKRDKFFNDRHNTKIGGPLKYLLKHLGKQ